MALTLFCDLLLEFNTLTQLMNPPDRDYFSRVKVAPSTLQEHDRDLRKVLAWRSRHVYSVDLTNAKKLGQISHRFFILLIQEDQDQETTAN